MRCRSSREPSIPRKPAMQSIRFPSHYDLAVRSGKRLARVEGWLLRRELYTLKGPRGWAGLCRRGPSTFRQLMALKQYLIAVDGPLRLSSSDPETAIGETNAPLLPGGLKDGQRHRPATRARVGLIHK